ncbi:ABC transporter permease [Massilia sp. TWR1-2-2]|uniref:ABC transporter permease n=1 Tax=Massilia sp. TWR1-2-2 TaxID=2804584 RepID=UPI003CE91F90
MLKLLSMELLKVKRSQALWMMFAVPLVVLLLNVLMTLKKISIGALGEAHWARLWMGSTMLWCYFMMPLYIALITSLLNGHEHKNQIWRLMLTLPVSRQLNAAKAVLAWLFVAGANAVLVGSVALTIALLGVAGASQQGAFVFPMLAFWAKVSLACIPILVIQHTIGWRVRDLVLPLAVGVMATIGITQIGSSEHWVRRAPSRR